MKTIYRIGIISSLLLAICHLASAQQVEYEEYSEAAREQSMLCEGLVEDDSYPDYRQVAYWHPLVEVKAGESFDFECSLPFYEGEFVVTVEGITEDGEPVKVVKKYHDRNHGR